ncbi:MAG: helix-turn-helix domain-containing protein, partial [Planctomycetaceae bacterium]|nr:helix-turn-helix domain-containing protein [Planctomycetaceae bacterium]
DTVRRYFSLYKEGGINGLLEIKYEGRTSFLTDAQKEQLKQHLRKTCRRSCVQNETNLFGLRE